MKKEITVAKFGSEIVCGDNGIDQEVIAGYVDGLVSRHADNGLIVVTSGAIKTGEMRVKKNGSETSEYDDVTLAQLGCTSVMHAWESEFESRGIMAGGLLTTHHEIEDGKEGSMLLQTLSKALLRGIVSLINENDALSDEELMAYAEAADNDSLASLIAAKSGASAFDIYTAKGGIYDDSGELIPEINRNNYFDIESMLLLRQSQAEDAGFKGSGRGGAIKKVQAARKAAMAGAEVSIMAPNADMTGENITRVVW